VRQRLVSGRATAGNLRCGWSVQIQDAGNKLANGDAQVAPEAALEAGVILGAAEKVAHQLAEDGTAAHELNHARGDGGAEERAAVETADDAGGKFQLRREGGFDPSGVFFRAAFGERAAEEFAGAHGVKKSFAREGVNPSCGVANHRPIFAQHRAIGESAFFWRRQDVAVKLCVRGWDSVFTDKFAEMRFELRAGMRSHAAANADGKMVAARKGPDVAFEMREEFYGDGVGRLRNEIALSHFQFVALKGARFGQNLITRTCGQHEEIGAAPFAIDGIAGLRGTGVNTKNVRLLDFAAGGFGAVQQHSVQDSARINDDGMRKLQVGALIVAADEFDAADKFFGIRIVEQEREALDGFVGEATAARLLPSEAFIKNLDFVSCAGELLAAHRARRSAADDCYL
jgi:hypothetical protein